MANVAKISEWFSYVANNKFRAFLLLFVLIVITYAQTFKFGFSHLDDVWLITRRLKLSNIDTIFSRGIFGFADAVPPEANIFYRPVQNVFYAAVKEFGGIKPGAYHLAQVLLHILVCWLLFRLLLTLTKSAEAALLLSCIFAVHPIVTQAVAWIPGAGDLLIGIFLLSCFLLLRSFLLANQIKPLLLVAIAVCFLLALLCKESAIAFAPVAVLYAILFRKNFKQTTIKIGIISVALAIAIAFWWHLRNQAIGVYSSLDLKILVDSLLKNSGLIIIYLGKIVFPYPLSPMAALEDLNIFPGLLAITLLIIAGFTSKGKKDTKLIIFGLGWYLFFLLPTLYIVEQGNYFYVYNHRAYLPLMGILIVVAELVALNRLTATKLYISIAILCVFTIISVTYLPVFKDPYTFFKKSIACSPHAVRAYEGLANVYLGEQKCDKVVDVYGKLIEIAPTSLNYQLMAEAYYCSSDINNALAYKVKSALMDSLSPKFPKLCIKIGDDYYKQSSDMPRAKYWYQKSLSKDSTLVYAMEMLGNVYINTENYDSAAYWFNKSYRINSSAVSTINGLAVVEYIRGNYTTAISMFNKALALKPGSASILLNLAKCYMAMNDYTNTLNYTNTYAAQGKPVPEELQVYLKGFKK